DVSWKTYPERLQEAGISWKVYQNELSIPVGFEGEEENWLANFTNNNLEFHKQYHVRFHPAHRAFLAKTVKRLEEELAAGQLTGKERTEKQEQLARASADLERYSAENFARLPEIEQE